MEPPVRGSFAPKGEKRGGTKGKTEILGGRTQRNRNKGRQTTPGGKNFEPLDKKSRQCAFGRPRRSQERNTPQSKGPGPVVFKVQSKRQRSEGNVERHVHLGGMVKSDFSKEQATTWSKHKLIGQHRSGKPEGRRSRQTLHRGVKWGRNSNTRNGRKPGAFSNAEKLYNQSMGDHRANRSKEKAGGEKPRKKLRAASSNGPKRIGTDRCLL